MAVERWFQLRHHFASKTGSMKYSLNFNADFPDFSKRIKAEKSYTYNNKMGSLGNFIFL